MYPVTIETLAKMKITIIFPAISHTLKKWTPMTANMRRMRQSKKRIPRVAFREEKSPVTANYIEAKRVSKNWKQGEYRKRKIHTEQKERMEARKEGRKEQEREKERAEEENRRNERKRRKGG